MRLFRKTQLKRTKNAGLGKGSFCKAHSGAEFFLRRKSGIVTQKRPSWCIDRDHKKEVVSVRVMRKSFTPLGHFFEGKIKWHLCFATLTSENATRPPENATVLSNHRPCPPPRPQVPTPTSFTWGCRRHDTGRGGNGRRYLELCEAGRRPLPRPPVPKSLVEHDTG